jgi:hypothetical protein
MADRVTLRQQFQRGRFVPARVRSARDPVRPQSSARRGNPAGAE